MAQFMAFDTDDMHRFADKLTSLAKSGEWRVIASNAHERGGVTKYYALLQKNDRDDYDSKLLDLIDSIDNRLSNIEMNTNK